MQLKSIFSKPVDRPIEGVIKADDRSSLYLEVEEYELTNEIEKRLESFLLNHTTTTRMQTEFGSPGSLDRVSLTS